MAKGVNPCIQKGRYGGSRYAGRRYLDTYGGRYEVAACECASGFIAHDIPKASTHVDKRTFKPCAESSNSISVLPCQEIFRHKDSTGTKRFKSVTKSKFSGCAEIEQNLLENREIIYEPKEILGLQILLEGYFREFETDPSERIRAFEREESELAIQQKRSKSSVRQISRSSIYDFAGPTPKDLRHVLLIDLLDRGYFSYDEKLEAAAWLIHEEMTTGDWISVLSEKIDVADFHRYQSRVYRILEEKKTARQKKWEIFWPSLTPKQKNAVELVYMSNDENRSREDIARSLKISLDSLNDRLEGAIKKLKAAFAEEEQSWTTTKAGVTNLPSQAHRENDRRTSTARNGSLRVLR